MLLCLCKYLIYNAIAPHWKFAQTFAAMLFHMLQVSGVVCMGHNLYKHGHWALLQKKRWTSPTIDKKDANSMPSTKTIYSTNAWMYICM